MPFHVSIHTLNKIHTLLSLALFINDDQVLIASLTREFHSWLHQLH